MKKRSKWRRKPITRIEPVRKSFKKPSLYSLLYSKITRSSHAIPIKTVRRVLVNRGVRHNRSLFSPRSISGVNRELKRSIIRRRCEEKVDRADKARRHAFFRAKHSGGTSRRPEHNQSHNRRC